MEKCFIHTHSLSKKNLLIGWQEAAISDFYDNLFPNTNMPILQFYQAQVMVMIVLNFQPKIKQMNIAQ
jgi:hypothetical protein